MANKLSDREYVKQILDDMDGKTNHMKAKAIARLFGGRIRQRLREGDTVGAIRDLGGDSPTLESDVVGAKKGPSS